MARYDIEQLLRDVDAYLKAKLPAKITALNSEKNNTISLAQFESGAFFVQSMDRALAAYPRFIFTGLNDVGATPAGPNVAQRCEIHVMVCTSEMGDPSIVWRLFRYQRAIFEVLAEGFSQLKSGMNITVKSMVPVAYQNMDTGEHEKVIGVSMEATLG